MIIAEFQAMMVQLNAVFAQQKALLSSLSGSPLPEPRKVNAHVVRLVLTPELNPPFLTIGRTAPSLFTLAHISRDVAWESVWATGQCVVAWLRTDA